ncbi:MAG: hypothetical protein HY054_01775 [Proteobacteria bacterium]|nr:hypothetical protein [Pseudomonadota bacterium]
MDLAFIESRYADSDEYRQRPLFSNQRLNSCVIMKHALRASERHIFNGVRLNATKLVFPFAKQDLGLGGESLFVGEPDFSRKLAQKIGAGEQSKMQDDLETLALIDSLPSFDPFLMRERLRQSGKLVARCYFDISSADTARMQKFVSSQIAALVELAFAGSGAAARELSVRLADKLMTDETAQSLDPLRATLRLSGDEYREGVFAWKGFLYYKWVVAEWGARLPDLARSILAARISNAPREDMETINTIRRRIVRVMGATMKRVQDSLDEYDVAFRSLQEGKPTAFRDFLLSAPSMFVSIGEAVGIIKHVDSFWRFRFPAGRAAQMDGIEALDIFQDFELTLSGVDLEEEAPAPAL